MKRAPKYPGNREYIELLKALAAFHMDDCPRCVWARSLEEAQP